MLYAISAHLKSYPAPAVERADSVPEIFGLLVLTQAIHGERKDEE